MWQNVFVSWLAILPFISWLGVYEGAKIAWFWGGGFFLSLVLLLCFRDRIGKIIKTSDYWYLAWVLVLLVSSLLGPHPENSIVGGSYRHQGVLFFFGLFVVAKAVSLIHKKQKNLLAKCLAAAVILESLIIIFQKAVGEGLVNGRPIGTFGEPNAAAGFLAIGSYFSTAPLSFTVVFLSILLTGSRAGLIAFLIMILARFVFHKKINLRIILLMLGLSAVVLFAFYKTSLVRRTSAYEDRGVFWQLGWQAIKQKPLLGYGAESGEKVYNRMFERAEMPLVGMMVDRSHNLFLDVAMWSGLLGLIIFLLWLVAKYKNAYFFAWLAFAMLQPLGVVHWVLLILMQEE